MIRGIDVTPNWKPEPEHLFACLPIANQLKIELENDKMSKNSIEVVFINRLTTLYKSMGSRRDEMLIYAPQHEDVIKTCRIRLGYKN